jgi:L-asparaginase
MVTVLNLGGTIDLDYRQGVVSQRAIHRVMPAGAKVIDLEPVQGNNLSWRHLGMLRARLVESGAEDQRFLITVGTDVLEEVLYFVSLVKRPGTAVALVGSFAPPAASPSEVASSLLAAMRWLEHAGDEGLAVCSDGEIIRGALVEKTFVNAWRFRAREITDERLPAWTLDPDATLASTPPRVPLVTVCVESEGWIRDLLLASKPDGLVVSGFGSGDVPGGVVPVLRALVAQRVPVVLASRSHPGIVEAAFPGVAGASDELLHDGVLGGGSLDGVLLRIRLLLALAARPHVSPDLVFQSDRTLLRGDS